MSVPEQDIQEVDLVVCFCPECGYSNHYVHKGFPKYIYCKDCHKRVYNYEYVEW